MPDATSNTATDPAAEADAARAHDQYESSQTFLLRTPDPNVSRLRWVTAGVLLLLFFAGIPLLAIAGIVPDDKVNILGQYLCFAIVALGIDLIWGYTGVLSLCQAMFFALGGYAMGMHLSLPEGGGQYDYPQFMTFAYYGHGTELPWFWAPFRHFWFAVFAGMAVPGLVAGIFGFVVLRNRVRGVYFSIITQAFAAACWLLISRNEMLLGGTNGLTNFYRPMTSDRHWKIGLYLLTLSALVVAYLVCRGIIKSRVGRVLIAVRDKETRLYFAGYKPYAFKVFAFSVGAMLAGVGGMLYAPQTAIITPQEMNVEASMLMVVMVALGGRGRLWGAVFGAILFRSMRSTLSSDLSAGWVLVEGLIAVVVVLVFPDGLLGIWEKMERQITARERLRNVIVTAAPLVTISLFVLAESLALMPRFLSEVTLKVAMSLGYVAALAVAVFAGVSYWRSRPKTNWWKIGGLLVAAVALFVFFSTRWAPQGLRDMFRLDVPLKYLFILLVFAGCGVAEWLAAENARKGIQLRAFEPVSPVAPSPSARVVAVSAGSTEGGA